MLGESFVYEIVCELLGAEREVRSEVPSKITDTSECQWPVGRSAVATVLKKLMPAKLCIRFPSGFHRGGAY